MSIRIRTVDGTRVALCAAETDAMSGDLYLDDGDHYALAAKFASDWQGETVNWAYPEEWSAMASQKLRDAETELIEWLAKVHRENGVTPRLREAMQFYRRHYPDDATPEQGDGR